MYKKIISCLLIFAFIADMPLAYSKKILPLKNNSHLRPLSLAESSRPYIDDVSAVTPRPSDDKPLRLTPGGVNGLLTELSRRSSQGDPEARAAFENTLMLIAAWLDRNVAGHRRSVISPNQGRISWRAAHRAASGISEFARGGLDYKGMEGMIRDAGRTDLLPVLNNLSQVALGITQFRGAMQAQAERASPGDREIAQSAADGHQGADQDADLDAPTGDAILILYVPADALRSRIEELSRIVKSPRVGEDRIESGRLLHRIFRVITACNGDESLLATLRPLTQDEISAAMGGLDRFADRGFSLELLRGMVHRAGVRLGRQDDELAQFIEEYGSVIDVLVNLAGVPAGRASPQREAGRRLAGEAPPASSVISRQRLEDALVGLLERAMSRNALEAEAREARILANRSLELIVAWLEGDPEILRDPARLDPRDRLAVSARLGEFADRFDYDRIAGMIQQAGRVREYQPVMDMFRGLMADATQPALGTGTDNQLGSRAAAMLQRRESAAQLIPFSATEGEMRAKATLLENFQRGMNDGSFGRTAMFADQHGQNGVLHRIVDAVDTLKIDEVIGGGDIFDRGDQNAQNFEDLKHLKQVLGDRAVFPFGNHCIMMIQALLLNDEEAVGQWALNGGFALMQEFNKKGLDPREVALWMLKNFKMFHIDERGFLHIHAGIRMDSEGNPLISREQLEEWQRELESIQRELEADPRFLESADNVARLARLFDRKEGAGNIFWDRMDKWADKFQRRVVIDGSNRERLFTILRQRGLSEEVIRNSWESLLPQIGPMYGIAFQYEDVSDEQRARMIDNYLAKLGVNGIVFGHDGHAVGFQMLNIDDRIFCLDMHKGDNGFVVFNGSGVRFNPMAESMDRPVASNARLNANIDAQLARLKQALGESPAAHIAAMDEHSRMIDASEAAMLEQASAAPRRTVFEKSGMRENGVLRVGWGDGTYELSVRQSRRVAGALVISDIKIAGVEVAGVIYANGEQKKIISLAPGEDLVMGLEEATEEVLPLMVEGSGRSLTYAFKVGGRAFSAQRSGDGIVLIEKKRQEEGKFWLSRRLSNRADSVSVELGRVNASRTTIRQEQPEPVTVEDVDNRVTELLRLMSIVPAENPASPTRIVPSMADVRGRLLEEDRRYIVAMIVACGRATGGVNAAIEILQGVQRWDDYLNNIARISFAECCTLFHDLRGENEETPELVAARMREFRAARSRIRKQLELRMVDDVRLQMVYNTFFSGSPAAVMHRIGNMDDLGPLIPPAVETAKPMADRIAEAKNLLAAVPQAAAPVRPARGPGISPEDRMLEEDRRYVVAMAAACDEGINLRGRIEDAVAILQGRISWDEYLSNIGFSLAECCSIYGYLRGEGGEVETSDDRLVQFKKARERIIAELRRRGDRDTDSVYFRGEMAAVMNRVKFMDIRKLVSPQAARRTRTFLGRSAIDQAVLGAI